MNRFFAHFGMDPTAGLHAGAALAALLVTVLLLHSQAAFVPPLVLAMIVILGVIGLVWRVRLGPPLVVMLVSAMQCRLREHWFGVIPGFDPPLHAGDLAIAGVLWAFVVCQCRYLEIAERTLGRKQNAVVRWLRRHPVAPAPTAQDRAGMARVFHWGTLVGVVLLLPAWPLAARWFWSRLPTDPSLVRAYSLPLPLLQAIVAVWLLGSVFLLGNALFGYACRLRRDPVEAELELNDLVWRELRREVDHIGRALRRE